jgi:hypothetical protein
MARFAAWLAPYQSPKLSAVAVTETPQQTDEKERTFTIDMFKRGKQVARVVDGECEESIDDSAVPVIYTSEPTKLIERKEALAPTKQVIAESTRSQCTAVHTICRRHRKSRWCMTRSVETLPRVSTREEL